MQLVGTLAVVISVLVLAYQGRELAKHTQAANDLAGVETHRELMRHMKSITDAFIQFPELRAHYYGTATTAPSVDDAARMLTVAEQYADVLEAGMLTQEQLPAYLSEYVGEWSDYAAYCVASSPVLRSYVRAHPGVNPPLDTLVASYDAAQATGTGHGQGQNDG